VVLLVPLLILIGCYFLLRLMTYELLAWPERFLDERQQIVRDKAHRNAYKIVKVACLLVPLYLCLHAVLWTPQAPAPTLPQPFTTLHQSGVFIGVVPNTLLQDVQTIHVNPAVKQAEGQTIILYEVVPSRPILSINYNGPWTMYSTHATTPSSYTWIIGPVQPIYAIDTMTLPSYGQVSTIQASSWPDSPASLLLYYGTLLLSLFLMALALPMSLVAWKE